MASSAVELAVGYISIIPEMRGVGPAVRRSLGEAENEAGRAGRNMGDQMSEGIGSTMKKAMVGAGVAAGALLAKGLMDSMDKEVSVDKLSASLGATAEQSESYGRIAGKVYAQAYGENLGEVTTAIDAVASSLKGVGGANIDDGSLDRLTKKALDFSAVYGTEVADSTQAVNQLMTSGLAKSADEGFDLLVASYQRVPAAMREEIPELMNEYGTFFSSLGFSGQDAFGVLVNASEQGAIAMDKVGDALKETGIRATDVGDKAAMEALTGIGLNATQTANALLAGGDTAKKAYGQMIDGLLKIKDPSEQAAQAVALFGTPLEDLNKAEIPAFLQAMSGAGASMDGFSGAADRMGSTLSDNAATKIESFKRTVSEGLTNLVGGVLMPAVSSIFGGIGTILGPVLTEVQGGITAFVGAFKDGGDEITSSGFAGFLEGLGVTARNLYDAWNTTLLPIVKQVGGVVLEVGQTALPVLWGAFSNGVNIVNGIISVISSVVGWFNQHRDVAIALGSVLAVALLPTMISLAATLAVQAGLWISQTAALVGYIVVQNAVNVATKAWAAAQWILNAALNANPIGLIILALTALVAGIVLAYRNSETFRNIVQAAWEGIQTAISFAWNSVIKPIFDFFVTAIRAAGDAATWLWNNAIRPAFDGIGSLISAWWNNIVMPAFDLFKAGVQALGDIAMWLWNNAIQPAFQGIGNIISGVWNSVIMPALEAIKSGIQGVGDFFSNVVSGIATVWDGLRSILARPVNFLINTVWNNGILKAWNAVAGFLPGIDPAEPLAGIPEHATGGAIGGPGGIDNVLMWGTRNEHMLTVDEVRKAGGHGAVYTLRDMIKRGIPFSWDNGKIISDLGRENVNRYGAAIQQRGLGNVNPEGLFDKILPGYKDGGEILPWHKQLENGHRAAKMRDGNPYTWGFEDCSGYMSMIADAIINGGDGVRRWATSSFPGGQPFEPGLGEGFSVGVHDDPGGPGGGHTSGTLTGVGPYATTNVESGGGHGYVAYGGPATGADSSQWVGVSPGQYHLAIGANGFFQSAGPGGGVGPSPADQSSFLTSKINDTFSAIVAPIREGIVAAIGSPPPEYLDIPPKFLDTGVDLTSKFLGEKVGSLGELLPGAWQKAKDLVGNLFDGGGIFPNNSLGINLSGKPEAVLTNDQWQLFSAFNKTLEEVGPKFMEKMADIAPKAGLEILGLEGTLLDPGHRYYTAARDIAKTASEFQAKRAESQPEQSQVNNDFSITVGQVVNPDPNQVARNLTDMQNRQAMRYAGRPV